MALRRALRAQLLSPFAGALQQSAASMSSAGPQTLTPPPNTARGATADLADTYITDSVDIVSQRRLQIMEPIFRCEPRFSRQLPPGQACTRVPSSAAARAGEPQAQQQAGTHALAA
jgi:hypothetical protein